MEEKFIQCLNNSLLVPFNIRKKTKKLKINSSLSMSKPLLISPPTPKLIKADTSEPQIRAKPPPRLINRTIDNFPEVNSLPIEKQKEFLAQIIESQQSALKILESRCEILEKIIKKSENFGNYSEKDTNDLVNLIEELTKTLVKTSMIEVELGVKTRLYEKKNLENSFLKNSNTQLLKRSQQSEHELKELRDKIRLLSEENLKLRRNSENAKQRYAEVNNKIQTLEESLWVISNPSASATQDSITKLKSAINALLRDAYYYKKEIQNL